MVAALNAVKQFEKMSGKISKKMDSDIEEKNLKNDKIVFSNYTMIGALAKYISTENDKFQPMNANFGILPELEGKKIKDKKLRYERLAQRSLEEFK